MNRFGPQRHGGGGGYISNKSIIVVKYPKKESIVCRCFHGPMAFKNVICNLIKGEDEHQSALKTLRYACPNTLPEFYTRVSVC